MFNQPSGLVEVFGKRIDSMNSQQPIFVEWREFLNTLKSKLMVYLDMQQERDLSELLDSQAKRGWVNLIDFQ